MVSWSRFTALAKSSGVRPLGDSEYLMLVDIFGAPERSVVRAVHVMIMTRSGDMAYGGMWNS